jgi:hypothetical protein
MVEESTRKADEIRAVGIPELRSATAATRRSSEEVALPALLPICRVRRDKIRGADEVDPEPRPDRFRPIAPGLRGLAPCGGARGPGDQGTGGDLRSHPDGPTPPGSRERDMLPFGRNKAVQQRVDVLPVPEDDEHEFVSIDRVDSPPWR